MLGALKRVYFIKTYATTVKRIYNRYGLKAAAAAAILLPIFGRALPNWARRWT